MKTNKYIILLLSLLLAGSLNAQASEYEYKAAFIERFTRFVEWPDSTDSDTFKIAVIGTTPLKSFLNDLFSDLEIKGTQVELISTNDIDDLSHANVVFISSSEKNRVSDILMHTNKFPILTIGDSHGYCAGGVHINMYVDDNYIRYEINPESIEKSNLKISSLLLASAKIVNTND